MCKYTELESKYCKDCKTLNEFLIDFFSSHKEETIACVDDNGCYIEAYRTAIEYIHGCKK